jgi:predicted ATPase
MFVKVSREKVNGAEVERIRGTARRGLVPPIGRGELLARLETLVIREGVRILTLLGPPGIGKTTASLALMARLQPHFAGRGGAWFCDLTATTTEAGLSLAVASLGRSGLGDEAFGPAQDVGELLATQGRTLLVLDNFEAIAFAGPLVARWCAQAEGLSVVVTSRERLGVAGEVVVEVPPLATPTDDTDDEVIEGSPAVQLFLQRCRDAGVIAPLEPPVVARVVRRLEGWPLAIELAAASLRVMTLEALEARVAGGQWVLGAAARTRGRYATLSDAIESSWRLLPPAERVALARCAVFAGGFAVELAEKVVGEQGALVALAALRDKSLLRVDEHGRLALYESVREFAAHRLDELDGDATKARDAHARALGELARRYKTSRHLLSEAPDPRASETIRWELENLAAAAEHALARPLEPELAAQLVAAAGLLRAVPPEQAVKLFSECLERLGPAHALERSMVRLTRHTVLLTLGQAEAALADLRALSADEALPRVVRLTASVYEGVLLRGTGHPRQAWDCHRAVAAELAQVPAPRLEAMNTACTGRLAFDLQDMKASAHFNHEALASADASGDRLLGALALANLAQMEQEAGRLERAASLMTSAMKRLRHVGEVYEAVYCCASGHLYFEWGKLEEGRRWYEEGTRALRAALRPHGYAALALAGWAALEAWSGHADLAEHRMADARRGAQTSRGPVVGLALELHQWTVDLHGAPAEGRAEVVRRCREELARVGEAGTAAAETLATSFEARFALRMTKRALEHVAGGAAAGVRVQRAGRWFQVGGQRVVQLGRRASLQRILAALAASHAAERGMRQPELVAIGWPGEQILPDAAATRVRVAIATLRRLGLKEHLVTSADGYRLDPGIVVDLCD